MISKDVDGLSCVWLAYAQGCTEAEVLFTGTVSFLHLAALIYPCRVRDAHTRAPREALRDVSPTITAASRTSQASLLADALFVQVDEIYPTERRPGGGELDW